MSSQLPNRTSNQRLLRLHHPLISSSRWRDRRLPNGIQVSIRIPPALLHNPWVNEAGYSHTYYTMADISGSLVSMVVILYTLWQVNQDGNMELAICQEARTLG